MNIKLTIIKALLLYEDINATEIARNYKASYSSVITWLNKLEELGYCNKEKEGSKFIFYKTQKLIDFKPFMDLLEK